MVLEIKIECGLWKVLEKSLKNGYNFFCESWFKYFFCSDTNKQGKKTTCMNTHTSRSLAPSYPAKLWSFCLKVVLPFSISPSCKLICPMTKNTQRTSIWLIRHVFELSLDSILDCWKKVQWSEPTEQSWKSYSRYWKNMYKTVVYMCNSDCNDRTKS